MSKTKIEWASHVWNPITGCTHAGTPGCDHCYAKRMARRLAGRAGYPAAPNEFRPTFHPDRLAEPLTWSPKKPRRVFAVSMGDLFHPDITDGQRDQIFAVMGLAPEHRFLVLTKRPARAREYFGEDQPGDMAQHLACIANRQLAVNVPLRRRGAAQANLRAEMFDGNPETRFVWPLPNVWIGVTVENRAAADARIPELLQIPAARRFLSCEPLLGPVELNLGEDMEDGEDSWVGCVPCDAGGRRHQHYISEPCWRGLDWVIAGGETGPGARPMHPDWARGLRNQCTVAGVPFFFKHWGEWVEQTSDRWVKYEATATDLQKIGLVEPCGRFGMAADLPLSVQETHCTEVDAWMQRVGKAAAGRTLDGRTWEQFPADASSQ